MTYIVKHLANIEDLKKELETNPDHIKYYAKYEGFDGSSEAIDYIDEKIEEYILNKSK